MALKRGYILEIVKNNNDLKNSIQESSSEEKTIDLIIQALHDQGVSAEREALQGMMPLPTASELSEADLDQITAGASAFFFPGRERTIGTTGDDTLTGGDSSDIGGISDDAIHGGSGDDFIDGEKGDDALYGGAGDDTIFGGQGDDTIYTSRHGADITYEQITGETDYSGDGRGYADGGEGDDFIQGGEMSDGLHGGAGDDTILSGTTTGTSSEYWGPHSVMDNLDGGEGNDILIKSGLGGSVMQGGEGDDTISARDGQMGHGGAQQYNIMEGGEGSDTFSFDGTGSHSVITDFVPGQDKIELFDFSEDTPFSISSTPEGTVIQYGDSTIVLSGVNLTPEQQEQAFVTTLEGTAGDDY